MFAANLVLESVALADHMRVGAVDQNFGYARTAVVVRGHHKSIRARAHHREQVARPRLRHLTFAREEIAALADRADHINGHRLAGLAPIDGSDFVVRLVQDGANQIVHRAIDHNEALDVGFFVIEHPRDEHSRVTDDHASGFGYYLEPESGNRLQERLCVLRWQRRLFLIRNPKPAAKVEIFERRDTLGAEPPDDRRDLLPGFRKRRHLGYLRADMR